MKKVTSLLLGLIFILAMTTVTSCGNDDEDEDRNLCTNSCPFASDGDCDDGGPGADFSLCDLGTDCNDCGTRN